MTSPHGSNSASLPQSSLPLPSHQYTDCCPKAKMFKCEGDSELDSVATNAVNMNHGSKRKQSLKLSQAKSYRNDDAKKLADQRWRQSINECYDILRVYTDKDIVFRDGTILKGKESKSRNDLLSKSIDLIEDLESLFSELCSRQPDSLNRKESLTCSREKFIKDKTQIKPKNLSLQH